MKVIRYILYIILVAAFLPTSCIWSEIVEDPVLGEGQTTVSMDIQFRPWTAALDGAETKSAGNSIKHINDLWVVIYKNDRTFFEKVKVSSDNTGRVSNYQNSELDVTESGFAESKYCHSTFDMELPLGKYRIYAIANYDLSSFTGTEEELKSIKLTWNVSDIAANNAMFGYFTDGEDGGSAPVITIDRSGKSLHAFVKRAASKVTVSFDGSNLYENIYIYLHTVQIKDIPKTCLMGKDNKPSAADQLIANGETQYLRPKSSTDQTGGVRITKGDPTGGRDKDAVHSETADALFFYENMQGTDPNKHQYNNFESKDNKPYGTYIEVKGYYVNKNAETASQGPIIYRFMLGKNVTDDFNAERSCHYKLVLKFKNNANDPDWHIEYEPENPEISVASPLYISYIHGESVDIPVTIRGGTNATLTAEIVENNWAYAGHKYEGRFDNGGDGTLDEGLWNGFLTLEGGTVPKQADLKGRKDDFELGRKKSYSPIRVESGSNTYHYDVKAYTRAISLGNSFSGNNVYVDKERTSKIKFTATVNGSSVSKIIEIIQVRRLVNPAGVWRSAGNDSPFHAVLMETEDEKNASFRPIESDGPWKAEIIEGDWIRISKDGTSFGTNSLEGLTGSHIDFHYKPVGTIGNDQSRFGVIRVLYHNNTCVHYIFVSQGLAPVPIGSSGRLWHMTNVRYNGVDEATPLHEGSMFRWNNVRAILPTNNVKPDYGFGKSVTGKFDCLDKDGVQSERPWPYATDDDNGDGLNDENEYYLAVNKSNNTFSVMTSNGKPATCADWNELHSLERYYGVLYGDNSSETKTLVSDAYSFLYDTDDKGMRGMFVWDQNRKTHLFFPIGSTGNGHRKHYDDVAYAPVLHQVKCVLRYAQRHMEMPENHTSYGKSVNVPLYYDLYERPGAIYWYRTWSNEFSSNSNNYQLDQYAHDINYFTFGFDSYGSNPVYKHAGTRTVYSSDAAYIRCVQN